MKVKKLLVLYVGVSAAVVSGLTGSTVGTRAAANSVEIALVDASASVSIVGTTSQKGYRMSVDFYPVTAFDEISNREMSNNLAQLYAEEALSSFLQASKSILFNKAQSALKSVGNGKVQYVFGIPTEAIVDAPVHSVEIRKEIVGGKRAEVKVDANTRLMDLRSTCLRDLRVAETLFAEKIACSRGQKDSSALQRKIHVAFSSFRKKTKEYDDLFRAEKAELVKKADTIERYLLGEIQGDDTGDDAAKSNGLPIADAIFRAPFGDLLKKDAILLTHGGARLIEMDDGSAAIVSVGFAKADNEDREDIAELNASAALAKLLAEEETVVRELSNKFQSSANGAFVGTENFISRKENSAMCILKTGETVGTWLSADRKRFFLAKGRIIRKQANERNGR